MRKVRNCTDNLRNLRKPRATARGHGDILMQPGAQPVSPPDQHPSRSWPACAHCIHGVRAQQAGFCNHPSTPRSVVTGRASMECEQMRSVAALASYGVKQTCGPAGRFFEVDLRRLMVPVVPQPAPVGGPAGVVALLSRAAAWVRALGARA